MTKTAIFDAFGTVVRIGRRTNPYRQLLREGIKQGRRPHPGDAHVIMTLNLELHELAKHVGILLSESVFTRPHWRGLIPDQEGLPEQMHLKFGLWVLSAV